MAFALTVALACSPRVADPAPAASRAAPPRDSPPDPAAWGTDHVGQPVPEFVSGDECLFCHRNDIGPQWQGNRHQATIRPAATASDALPHLGEMARNVDFVLGGRHRVRFLARSRRYGKLALLSASWAPPRDGHAGRLLTPDAPRVDEAKFGASCAGCHATAVDPATQAFSALSLDCYTCHGDATLEHTKNAELMLLGRAQATPARVVISICGQCHIRTGRSRSTGLPYPANFVAGDNLFRDFAVDLSVAALARLGPADRHVLENVRDVVLHGKDDRTCVSCHAVHKQSSRKHRGRASGPRCATCHDARRGELVDGLRDVHSAVCEY